MMRVERTVARAIPDDVAPAVRVWQAANSARGLQPTSERVTRVQVKLQAADALFVVARSDGTVVAMALAEPGRALDGAGATVPGYGHVSMVSVAPDRWGCGVGSALLAGLHEHAQRRDCAALTLWTREGNTRARRLYERSGYRRNGRRRSLPSGEPIIQLERP